MPEKRNPLKHQALTNDMDNHLADYLAFLAKNDPELAAIVKAWPDLPDAIRAGILAMVKTAGGAG